MRPLSASSALQGPPLTLCDIIQRGYLSQVPLLVKLGIPLDSRGANHRTPLMLTAFVQPEGWGVGVARLLIEAGIRMTPRDRQGRTALHHACIYERLQLVHVLLNAPDFDLAQKDRFGNTALHYAAMSGNAALVKLLASHYQRYRLPLDSPNHQHGTARDEAARRGLTHCADILDQLTPVSVHPTGRALTPDLTPPVASIVVVLSADNSSENLAADPGEPSSGNLLKPGSSGPRRALSANAATRRSESRLSPRPSLPVLSDSKSGDPTQKLFARDNRCSEDTSTLTQKSCQKETIEITSLEKPPSRSNHKSPTVFRERTNLHLNKVNVHTVHCVNNNSSTHKPCPSPQLRRGYTFTAGSSHSLLPHEKDPDNIIHVASEHDFRNTREYVLKLTRLTPAPETFDADCIPGILPHTTSAHNGDHSSGAKLKGAGGSWRGSMRFLYQHYEYQWSPSWRKAANPPPQPPALLLATDPREECKDKKFRRSGSQISELSANSLSRLRKINASRRRISNVGLLSGVGRVAVPDPGRDTDTSSPDTAVHGTCSTPLTLKKQDTKATQRSIGEDAACQNRPRQPADSTSRSSPSPDGGGGKTFITHDQSNNNSDVTSPGNGNAAIAAREDGGNFRPQPGPPSRLYPAVPAVTASLVVDGNTDAQHVNAEPAQIDTSRLYVFSDVDDDDDDNDEDDD